MEAVIILPKAAQWAASQEGLSSVSELVKVPLGTESSQSGRKRRKSTILTDIPKTGVLKKKSVALMGIRGKKQE
jgi:hypothetical protein